jgi:hypothetical protein
MIDRRRDGSPRRLLSLMLSVCLVLASVAALQHDVSHLSGDIECIACVTVNPGETLTPTITSRSTLITRHESPWVSHSVATVRAEFTQASARAPPRLS